MPRGTSLSDSRCKFFQYGHSAGKGGAQFSTPLKPLITIVLYDGPMGFRGPQLDTHDCRETPNPREAARLIAVVFSSFGGKR